MDNSESGGGMNDEPVRIGLVGTGGIAAAHVRAVRDQGARAELVGAVDIDPARLDAFCGTHGIANRYSDVESLLHEARPHVVLIATPPFTHCDLAVQSMAAGAWVLCEKPLCASLAEMDRIEAAEAEYGVYCSSVFQWRFGSGGQHLKQLIERDALGRPLVGNVLITWYRTPDYYAVPWRGKWQTELGGTTMTHGIHAFDLVLWLLGEWQEVRAMTGTLDRNIEVEDVSMALVRFANGAQVSMTSSVLSPRQSSYLRLDFQKATCELTSLYGYTNADWVFSMAEGAPLADQLAQWQDLPAERPATHGSQLEDFLGSLARGERPVASGADVRGTLDFLSSLYKAAHTGAPVMRGSIGRDDPYYHRLSGQPA